MRKLLFLALLLGSSSLFANKLELEADNQVGEGVRAITLNYGESPVEPIRDEAAVVNPGEDIEFILDFIRKTESVTEVSFDPATSKFTVIAGNNLDIQPLINSINERLSERAQEKKGAEK